jgi:D-tagatose-1,6-bisphosphate aldolase subunit GatZ/KbaZ
MKRERTVTQEAMDRHTGNAILPAIIAAHKRGSPLGVYSICSANPFVLEAGVQQALEDGSPLLIESTCNQVNQEGGYTGMTPAGFRDYVQDITDKSGLPRERLILGGDHLGPSPWQHESVESAMTKARVLVRDCVLAGYTKIHLDASVKCADDAADSPLDRSISARRTAELCLAAENTRKGLPSGEATPCYVIGTEVPLPGGAQDGEDELAVTEVEDAQETIELTREAFKRAGLEAAWERVIAVVVQPGVEYGDDSLFVYDRQAAARLSRFIDLYEKLVFEAHSTDYQSRDTLRMLVKDHFAILKVGPALTFAFREAVFALAMMETEWLSKCRGIELSRILQVLEEAMLSNPGHWIKYYAGSKAYLQFARKYSFSDRSRYYWPDARVRKSLARLLDNLERHPVPLTLLSQFLPMQYERVRAGALPNTPTAHIHDKIRHVLADYAHACGVR